MSLTASSFTVPAFGSVVRATDLESPSDSALARMSPERSQRDRKVSCANHMVSALWQGSFALAAAKGHGDVLAYGLGGYVLGWGVMKGFASAILATEKGSWPEAFAAMVSGGKTLGLVSVALMAPEWTPLVLGTAAALDVAHGVAQGVAIKDR